MAKKGENYNLLGKVNKRLHLIYHTQRNMMTRSKEYDNINTYCMFIGYPRSGHTLIGASLDAHPNIVLGHEMDALKYIIKGESRDKVYSRLLAMSRTFITIGGQWMNYNYKIPGQYQGRATEIKVIGDKKGGGSTNKIHRDYGLLAKLKSTVGDRIKMVHVIRNPFDIITTRARGGNLVLAEVDENILIKAADDFFREAETVHKIKQDNYNVCDVRHEDYIGNPKGELRRLCEFLEVPVDEKYLDDCAEIVFTKPKKSRLAIEWSDKLKLMVMDRAAKYPFLQGYTFDS